MPPDVSNFFDYDFVTFDGSGDKTAIVLRARQTVEISKLAVMFRTVTTPNGIHLRVETVDTSTGLPTGTLWAANTFAPISSANVNAGAINVVTATMTANATVNAGQYYAIVVQPEDADAINLQVCRFSGVSYSIGGQLPFGAHNTTGSYDVSSVAVPVVGAYDATTSKWLTLGFGIPLVNSVSNTSAINTGTGASTGTRRGMRISVPAPMRLRGMWAKFAATATADFDVEIYNTGGTKLATLLSGADMTIQRSATSNSYFWYLPFETSYSLAANTVYYVVITPTTANSVTLHEATVADAAHWDSFGGQDFHLAAFISSAWATTTTRRPWWSLQFDQVDDGAGGASGGGLKIAGTGGLAG